MKDQPIDAMAHYANQGHWWFTGRRKILASLLARFPFEGDGWSADVGGGPGIHASLYPQKDRMVLLDMSFESLRLALVNHPVRGSATGLPFLPESLDGVWMLDILEHLDRDAEALKEAYRVLRPGGKVLITVPAFPFLWGPQDDIADHKRRYRRGELVRKIREANFQVRFSSYFNSLLFPAVALGRWGLRRIRWKGESEASLTPAWANGVLGTIFGAERFFLKLFPFPIGVSIVVVAQR